MLTKIDFIIEGKHARPMLADVRFEKNGVKKPVIVFCHGFKGFKDFGCFNLIADFFAENGFVFIKFNFSHNGTTPDYPFDFVDLEAFATNTFSIELDDLGAVLDEVAGLKNNLLKAEADIDNIILTGHSRGGGIAILKAFEDKRVKSLITWASVNEFGKFWSEEIMEKWKREGIRYELNGRTKQMMPMYYSLYEDLEQNYARLNIPLAVKNLEIPFLIVHGEKDETVKVESAWQIKSWNPSAKLEIIPGTNHTFDGKHPWEQETLPEKTLDLIRKSLDFLKFAGY